MLLYNRNLILYSIFKFNCKSILSEIFCYRYFDLEKLINLKMGCRKKYIENYCVAMTSNYVNMISIQLRWNAC
jgi:hypothetical protein